jgi:hypothetical protein
LLEVAEQQRSYFFNRKRGAGPIRDGLLLCREQSLYRFEWASLSPLGCPPEYGIAIGAVGKH